MSDERRRELYANPGDGDGSAATKEGGRDQADIARLLRALNEDLRDDEPAPPRGGPRAEPTSAAAPPRRPSSTGGMIGGRPSTIVVGVAIVAAAAIGLGSVLISGPSAPVGGEPPNLIVPSQTAAERQAAAPPPAVSFPPVATPPATAVPAGLTPGQTATIVRPQTDPSASESATVVVQPLFPDAGPTAPQPVQAQQAGQTAPKPASAQPTSAQPTSAQPAAPTPPKPAATAAPAVKTAPVGGAGHWAVQVGTFSVSANADQLARRLSQSGRQAYVVDWQDRQGRTWKAVRVGNFSGEAAARGVAAQLKSEMNISGQVIDLR